MDRGAAKRRFCYAAIDLIAETFNMFNPNNFTLTSEEGRRDFGEPESGQFRTMQFEFRLTF